MKKMLFGFIIFLLFLFFIFLNLGKWMDVTEKPVKADIIVCLGGGDHHRINRSLELYRDGYAKKGLLLLTGDDVTPARKRRGYKDFRVRLLKEKYSEIQYAHFPDLTSTREEVKYIKNYMKDHAYKSALIVTDPPHSGRYSLLNILIRVEGDENMTFHMVSSGVKWWDRKHYYKNKFARKYTIRQFIKIPYNIFKLLCDC